MGGATRVQAGLRAAWLATALLAGPLQAAAQFRHPDPPVRQPTLIQPIAPSELRAAPARDPAPPPATARPGTPAPDQDRFYDTGSPAHARLQKAHEALAGFPLDRGGFVDWAAALATGRIAPRADLAGLAPAAAHDLDVVLRNTKEMPWVRFPHRAHSDWLDCASCHPVPFAGKAGSARITMEAIFRGEACGMCHGRVAFPAWHQCERCHSVARPGEGALYEGAAPTSR